MSNEESLGVVGWECLWRLDFDDGVFAARNDQAVGVFSDRRDVAEGVDIFRAAA
jgi:hypothetical protein